MLLKKRMKKRESNGNDMGFSEITHEEITSVHIRFFLSLFICLFVT